VTQAISAPYIVIDNQCSAKNLKAEPINGQIYCDKNYSCSLNQIDNSPLTIITQATEVAALLVEASNAFNYGEALFICGTNKAETEGILGGCHSLKTEGRPDVYFPPASENETTGCSAIFFECFNSKFYVLLTVHIDIIV
jgi:hypothetical protein